jgi:hypothetical protein
VTGQEAVSVEEAFAGMAAGFEAMAEQGLGGSALKLLALLKVLADDRAALVAERDEALENGDPYWVASRDMWREKALQAVAERDRYRDALRSEIEKRHYRGDGKRLTDAEIDALVVAARAVSTP